MMRIQHGFKRTAAVASMLALLVNVLTGCRGPDEEVERFIELSYKEQQMALSTLPLQGDPERQVHVYLEARRWQHPTNPALAEIVARGGADVIPILLSRLTAARDHIDVLHVIEVFHSMQFESYYCVRCDDALMHELETSVSKLGSHEDYGKDLLASIRSGELIDPNIYSRPRDRGDPK